jgi:pyruvate/2-oxoglutarate dehydrogenase complex dihydrolipoamide acyltransferase (E2) component
MAVEVLLPKMGFSMNEGTLADWLVPDGSQVNEGQLLFMLEADKSVNEIESPATGVLKIIVPAGEVHAVGTVLATIE